MAAKSKKAKKASRKAKPSASAAQATAQATTTQEVAMVLNGNAVGMVDPAGKSIGQVAQDIAREHGLKTYSVLVDGVKVLADGAAAGLSGHRTIEVFAKETRG